MKIENAANLFKTLSTERRLKILLLLLEHNQLSSSEIAQRANLKEGITSACLTRLSDIGLLWRQPTGNYVFYGPNREVIKNMIDFLREHL